VKFGRIVPKHAASIDAVGFLIRSYKLSVIFKH